MFYPLFQTYHTVTSKFGEPRSYGPHNGIDIAVPVQTYIRAPLDGTLINSYSNPSGGNQMIIQHPSGIKTGYAHLYSLMFPVGHKFTKGDIIGFSGSSGTVTGPHLHFTVTDKSGNKIDPEPLYNESYGLSTTMDRLKQYYKGPIPWVIFTGLLLLKRR